ncbi:MAG: hypothetical protein LBN22_03970 [Clostridiales Family XIII bacterium]|jgi:hypothetical protein|nr:hypothetical protein [Clostridiales Family XIII bacterium]
MFRDVKKIKETLAFADYEYRNIGETAKGIVRFNKVRHNAQVLKTLPNEDDGTLAFFIYHLGPAIAEDDYPDEYKIRIT